jgi:hypothetical protein
MRRAVIFLAALSALIAAAPSALAAVKLASPDRGVYHAAHPDFGLRDAEVSPESVREFAAMAGRKIVWSYVSWHWSDGLKFPSDQCRALHGEGVVPLIGIMPWSAERQGEPEPIYTLDRILSGEFDEALERCAEEVRALGFPIMIEFGPEANGSWFPWSGAWNGRDGGVYGDAAIPDGPERFRDSYRRIAGIFRRVGASDVTWVFHIAAVAAPKEAWNAARYYYPGDDWVDWIGASVYGAPDERGAPRQFDDVMKHLYPGMCAISPSRPLAILELGVAEHSDKPGWIRDALGAIASGAYPRIRAVSWWNKTRKPNGVRSTLEIDSSAESLEAYRFGVRDFVDEAVWRDDAE